MIRLLAFLGTGSILTAAPTALDRYVAQPDPAYRFQLERTVKLHSATAFQLDMTSQRFLTTKEVDRPEWRHWVTIIKPDRVKHTAGRSCCIDTTLIASFRRTPLPTRIAGSPLLVHHGVERLRLRLV